jgi:hypothetical protein
MPCDRGSVYFLTKALRRDSLRAFCPVAPLSLPVGLPLSFLAAHGTVRMAWLSWPPALPTTKSASTLIRRYCSATVTPGNLLLRHRLSYPCWLPESERLEQVEFVVRVFVPAPMVLAYLSAPAFRQRLPAHICLICASRHVAVSVHDTPLARNPGGGFICSVVP